MKSVFVSFVAFVLGVGIAWAASGSGPTVWGMPVVVLIVVAGFAIQWLVFIHALLARTERFFDLTGSVTYIALAILALLVSPSRSALSVLMAAMVVIWAVRLGTFLFRRVLRSGGDDRFDEILKAPPRLFMTWTLQGLWIALTGLAAWIVISSGGDRPFSPWSIIGLVVWACGITVEVVADAQKSAFRARTANRGEFVHEGLWSWSRHPNYFGEILLWTGVFLAAAPVLSGWQWLAVLSPVFVTVLLTRVSGIPLLEKKADSKWGSRTDYQEYMESTSVLVPLPPSR